MSWAKKLNPSDYYLKFIERNVRPDGRDINQSRKTSIKFGGISSANGSGSAKIGNTSMVAGITAQIGHPTELAPAEGDIDVHIHLTPLSSAHFVVGKQPEKAIALSSFIKRVIVSTEMVSLQDLCIEEGNCAWQLNIDVVCLDYDGNAEDTALLAIAAALRTVRLPKTVISEDGIVSITAELAAPLVVQHIPIPLSFGIFSSGTAQTSRTTKILVDPTSSEEAILTGLFTIIFNSNGKLCAVHKHGGPPITVQQLRSCMAHCTKRADSVIRLFS